MRAIKKYEDRVAAYHIFHNFKSHNQKINLCTNTYFIDM